LAVADTASARAKAIGAANTLVFGQAGAIAADNTDAPALIEALPFPANGRTACVLGAGGSARAAVWALLDAGAAEVFVWNRSPERARRLCAAVGGTPSASLHTAEVLVNCTSIGLDANDDPFKQLPLTADAITSFRCVVDYVYGQSETRLVQAARGSAVPVVDGLQLLIGQGALSFEQFTGRPASVRAMRASIGDR
jgi:shikimate dehydrogenase